MIPQLHNVKLLKDKEIVYDENLHFRAPEDMNEDITHFMKFIRPELKFDTIKHEYLRDLKSNEV